VYALLNLIAPLFLTFNLSVVLVWKVIPPACAFSFIPPEVVEEVDKTPASAQLETPLYVEEVAYISS